MAVAASAAPLAGASVDEGRRGAAVAPLAGASGAGAAAQGASAGAGGAARSRRLERGSVVEVADKTSHVKAEGTVKPFK